MTYPTFEDPRVHHPRLGEAVRIHIPGRGTFPGRCIGTASFGWPEDDDTYIAYDAPDGTHTVWLPADHDSIILDRIDEVAAAA